MRLCYPSLRHEGALGIGRLVVSLFWQYITFAKSASYAVDDICWWTGEMTSDLDGSLESRYFLNVTNERAHLIIPGWLLVWNAFLTKLLPMFLSRLNKINGGCGKILAVLGSFWSNLKFNSWFRMIDFTEWLWRWNVRLNEWNSITAILLWRFQCWLPIN